MKDLGRALGSWADGDPARPRYVRLAESIQGAIERGDLAPGTRLPPERLLAQTLRISRNTATAAYELLRSKDAVSSRQGSGTYVRARPARRRLREAPRRDGPPSSAGNGAAPDHSIEFLAAAFPGRDLLTPDVVAEADDTTRLASDAHGYVTYGLPALRAAIADHVTASGLPTTQNQVLVTSGAQAAIFLAAALLVGPGDVVLVEDPTWLGAIGAYRAAGAEVVGIPTGPDGISIAACRDLIARRSPALVHVSPSFNNPTGFETSQRSRLELGRVARVADVPIVEDNTLADLHLGPERLAPLAATSGDAVVLSIGSTSKLFWGGLRVGWIRAPEALIDRLAQTKLVVDYATSLPGQALSVALFRRLGTIRAARREQAAARLAVLEGELQRALPEWRWRRPDGGLSLWVQLPRGLSVEFCEVARRHGVVLTPGTLASPAGGHTDRIRLPFVHERDTLVEGVRRLAAAWSTYDGTLDRGPVRHVIV